VIIDLIIQKKIAFVEFDTNGKRGLFILDTGASISLIDKAQANEYDFEYYPQNGEGNIHGLGGKNSFNVTSSIDLRYGTSFKVRHKFYSSDLGALKSFLLLNNIKILGILGADFFLCHKVIIDYSKSRLVILGEGK
jgi:hypothetical protein